MSKRSESYLVDVELLEDDECRILVTLMAGSNIKFIKVFSDEEAKKVYKLLTEKE